MDPDPMSASWRILQGDAAHELAELPAASAHVILADPPYGTASSSKVTKQGSRIAPFDISWDRELPLDWIPAAAKVLRPGGAFYVFTDTKAAGTLWSALQEAGLRPLQVVFWIKDNPTPNPRKNYASGVELVVFARKPGKVHAWNAGGAMPNYYHAPIVGGHERLGHPTQKPLALIRWILRHVTNPGDLVVDPFAGSGTTGEAAYWERLRFVGIENDPGYARMAERRLVNASRQGFLAL